MLSQREANRISVVYDRFDSKQSIDNRVPSNMDLLSRHILLAQRLCGSFSRSEMLIGNGSNNLAVHLLWPRRIYVPTPKTCLNVRHWNTSVIRSDSTRHRCCCISLNDDPARADLIEHLADADQQSCAELI